MALCSGCCRMGAGSIREPGLWNLDLSVSKYVPIHEGVRMQIRADMFNALNHPNFDNPRDASTGSPSIAATNGFASACCATAAPPSTQTIVQTGEAARVIQFGFKFLF